MAVEMRVARLRALTHFHFLRGIHSCPVEMRVARLRALTPFFPFFQSPHPLMQVEMRVARLRALTQKISRLPNANQHVEMRVARLRALTHKHLQAYPCVCVHKWK